MRSSEGRGSPAHHISGAGRSSNASDSERPRRRTDNVDEVLRRKAEAEKIMAARRAALIAEQNEKMRRINEQRNQEKKDRSRIHAEKELKRQKEALDRRTAYLEAQNQKKEAILAKAHAAASRTAALNKNKPSFAFGSSTPREISYLQTVPKDQRAYDKKLSPTSGPLPPPSPQPSTANATPTRAARSSMMTASMYVPSKGTSTTVRPPRPAAAPRSVTKSAPSTNLMTQSMYTPTPSNRSTRQARPPTTTPTARPRSSNGPPRTMSPAQKRVSQRSAEKSKPALPARARKPVNGHSNGDVATPVSIREESPEKKIVLTKQKEESKVDNEKKEMSVEVVEPQTQIFNAVETERDVEEEHVVAEVAPVQAVEVAEEEVKTEVMEKDEIVEPVASEDVVQDSTLIDFGETVDQKADTSSESVETTVETVRNNIMQMSLHDELAALMGDQPLPLVDTPVHNLLDNDLDILAETSVQQHQHLENEDLLVDLHPQEEAPQEVEAQPTTPEVGHEQQPLVEVLETETPAPESVDESSSQVSGETHVSPVTNLSEEITEVVEVVVRPASPVELDYVKESEKETIAEDPIHKVSEEVATPVEHAPPSVPSPDERSHTPTDPEVKKSEDSQEKSENISPTSGSPPPPRSPPEERKSEILVKYEQEEKDREARKARLAAIMNKMRGGANTSPPNGTTNGSPSPVPPTLDSPSPMSALQRVAALSNNPRISQVVSKHASNPNLEDAVLPGAVPEPPQDPLIMGSHHQNGIPSQL